MDQEVEIHRGARNPQHAKGEAADGGVPDLIAVETVEKLPKDAFEVHHWRILAQLPQVVDGIGGWSLESIGSVQLSAKKHTHAIPEINTMSAWDVTGHAKPREGRRWDPCGGWVAERRV